MKDKLLTAVLFAFAITGASWTLLEPLRQPKLVSVSAAVQGQPSFKYKQYGYIWTAIADCNNPGWTIRTGENDYQYQGANDAARVAIVNQVCTNEDDD
ncbi:hypothetical protein A6769_10165 [Nostoc punctiforme NIES-2108]|uniref:Uncharacterized protein n=1 Tax=Nostoc punctiforme NIES-2108 TaxID=1356359 RepID=A0A367RNH2_NOSPU|nr:hypothetical protein A6769_10165 [Nostoc punctiforme NIES-2108]